MLNVSLEVDNLRHYQSRVSNAARVAYALCTIADSMNALDEDERANFELYTELLGMINSRANGNLNAATFTRYTEIYDALGTPVS